MRIEPESGCTNLRSCSSTSFSTSDGDDCRTRRPHGEAHVIDDLQRRAVRGNPLRMPLSSILVRIAPLTDSVLEQSHDAVQQQSDQTDDDHSGDHNRIDCRIA